MKVKAWNVASIFVGVLAVSAADTELAPGQQQWWWFEQATDPLGGFKIVSYDGIARTERFRLAYEPQFLLVDPIGEFLFWARARCCWDNEIIRSDFDGQSLHAVIVPFDMYPSLNNTLCDYNHTSMQIDPVVRTLYWERYFNTPPRYRLASINVDTMVIDLTDNSAPIGSHYNMLPRVVSRPTLYDSDHDFDIDLVDFAAFQNAMTGPGQ